MKWLALLLALASMGGSSTHKPVSVKKCKSSPAYAKQHRAACKKALAKPQKRHTTTQPSTPGTPGATATPGGPAGPDATPTPTATSTPVPGQPTPSPTATPTPTATPRLPTRTSVDLKEWSIDTAYPSLAAGRVTFNANNKGEDDHNLAVRGGGKEYGSVDLAPGDSTPLVVTLPAGTYTLYCSLLGHEDAGMKTTISIR